MDKIGNDTNINLNGICAVLKKALFTDEEIAEFLCFVGVENTNVYVEKAKKLDEEAKKRTTANKAKIERRRQRKEKQFIKNNCLKNSCSIKTKELFDKVDKLLKDAELTADSNSNALVSSYSEVFLDKNENLLSLFSSKDDLIKALLISISIKRKEIIDYQEDFTEDDLKLDIEQLETLYNNYEKVVNVNEDEQKESNYQEEPKKNLYYLVNQNNGKRYIEISKDSNKEPTFRKRVNNGINKIASGVVRNNAKPIEGVDSGYYFMQNKVAVGYIIINEDNYIILTATMHDDFYPMINNIVDQNIEQIERIKKEVISKSVGGK